MFLPRRTQFYQPCVTSSKQKLFLNTALPTHLRKSGGRKNPRRATLQLPAQCSNDLIGACRDWPVLLRAETKSFSFSGRDPFFISEWILYLLPLIN